MPLSNSSPGQKSGAYKNPRYAPDFSYDDPEFRSMLRPGGLSAYGGVPHRRCATTDDFSSADDFSMADENTMVRFQTMSWSPNDSFSFHTDDIYQTESDGTYQTVSGGKYQERFCVFLLPLANPANELFSSSADDITWARNVRHIQLPP